MPTSKLHYQMFLPIIVGSAFWLIFKAKLNYSALLQSRVFIAAMAYALLYAISLSWSNHEDFSGKFRDFKSVIYLIFFWLVILYAIDGQHKKLELTVKVFMIVGFVSVFVNASIFYGIHGEDIHGRFYGLGRLWSPLWSGAIYGALAVLSLAILLEKYTTLQRKQVIFLIVAYLVFFAATVLSHSRTPIGAMIILSALVVMFSSISTANKLKIFVAAFVVSVVAIALLYPAFERDITRGQSYRLDLWMGFWERAKEHLLLGHGAGSRVSIIAPGEYVHDWRHYHNAYLGSLVELGIVGLLLHFVVIGVALHVAWQHRSNAYIRIAVAILLFTCLAKITFGQGIVTRMNVQWLLFWMPLIIISMYELKQKQLSIRRYRQDESQSS